MKKVLILFVLLLLPLAIVIAQQTTYKVELQYNITNTNNIGEWYFSSRPYNGTNTPLGQALIDVNFSGPGTKQVNIDEVFNYSQPITNFQYFSGGDASCDPFGQGPQFASFTGSQCTFVNIGFSMCLNVQPGNFPNLNKLFPIEDFIGLNPGSGNIDDCGFKEINVGTFCRFRYRLYAVYQSNQIEILPYGDHARIINISRTGNLTQIPYGQPFSLQVEYVNNPIKPSDTSALLTGLTFVPCPPGLDGGVNPNPDPIAPTCVGDSDGGFDVTFDRVLRADEKMSISVHPGTTDPSIIDTKQNLVASDFSGRTYRFLGTNLAAGSYRMSYIVGPIVPDAFPTVAGTDGFFTITDPPPVAFTQTTNDASCMGTADGAISISAQGGTPPYQYSRDNGSSFQNSNTFSGLALGNYSIVVEDNNGCTSEPAVITINDGASPPTVTFLPSSTATAANGQGRINILISGGTTPYQYSWTKDNILFTPVNPTNLTGLDPGEYKVIVTDNNGIGCASEEAIFTIEPLPALTVTITPQNGVLLIVWERP